MASIDGHLKRAGSQMERVGSSMSSIGQTLTVAITAPLLGVGAAALKAAGDMESAKIGFTTLLKSGEAATAMLKELRTFALKTPFTFPDLVTASQRMMAMGFAAKEVIPSLTAIGNATAALGRGPEVMDRIVLALGQMRNSAKVSAQDMNQLTQAGIDGWGILAKASGLSIKEIRAQAKDLFTGAEASALIMQGMAEKFKGGMEAQSHGLKGMMSNVQDAITFTLTDIGNKLLPFGKDFIANNLLPMLAGLSSLAQAFGELPASTQTSILSMTAFGAAIPVVILVMGTLIEKAGQCVTALTRIAAAFGTTTIGLAARVTVWTAAAYELGRFALAVYDAHQAEAGAKKQGEDLERGLRTLAIHLRQEGITSVNDLEKAYNHGEISQQAFLKGMQSLAKAHGDTVPKVQSAADATNALAAAEQKAAAAAELRAKALATLGVGDSLKTLRETEKAFSMMAGSLSDPDLLAAGHKLEEVLSAAFRAGTIDAKEFDRVIDKVRQAIGQLEADLQAKLGKKFQLTALLGDFEAQGASFQQWMGDVATKSTEAQTRLAVMTDGVAALGLELAKLPQSSQLIPPEAMKGMEDSLAYWQKVQKEEHEGPLKKVGVSTRRQTDLDEIIKANNEIQSGTYTPRVQQESAERTLRAVIEHERAITGQSTRQLELEIQLKTIRGESANAQIIALENLRIKQDAQIESTQRWGKLYVDMVQNFHGAFQTLGSGVSDAIMGAKSWKEAWTDAITSIAKMFLDTLVGTAMKAVSTQLANWALGSSGGAGQGFAPGEWNGPGGGGLVGAGIGALTKWIKPGSVGGIAGQEDIARKIGSDAFKDIYPTTSMPGGIPKPGGKTGGTGASSGMSSAMGWASLGVDVASGIATGIQLARIESDVAKIEISTRQTINQLISIQGTLNTYLPSLLHITNVWGTLLDGFDKLNLNLQGTVSILNNILSDNPNGLGGGFWGTAGGPGARTAEELKRDGPFGGGVPGVDTGQTAEGTEDVWLGALGQIWSAIGTTNAELLEILAAIQAGGGAGDGGGGGGGEGAAERIEELLTDPGETEAEFVDLSQSVSDAADSVRGFGDAMDTAYTDLSDGAARIGAATETASEQITAAAGYALKPGESFNGVAPTLGPGRTLQGIYDSAKRELGLTPEQVNAGVSKTIEQGIKQGWIAAGTTAEQYLYRGGQPRKPVEYEGDPLYSKAFEEKRGLDEQRFVGAIDQAEYERRVNEITAAYQAAMMPATLAAIAQQRASDPMVQAFEASTRAHHDLFQSTRALQVQVNTAQQQYFQANSGTALYDLSRQIGGPAALQTAANNSALLTTQVNQMGSGVSMQSGMGPAPILQKYSDAEIQTAMQQAAIQFQQMEQQRAQQDAQMLASLQYLTDQGNVYTNYQRYAGENSSVGRAWALWGASIPKTMADLIQLNIDISNREMLGQISFQDALQQRSANKNAYEAFQTAKTAAGSFNPVTGKWMETQVRGAAPIDYAKSLTNYSTNLATQWGANSVNDFSAFNGGSMQNSSTPPGGVGGSPVIYVYAMNPDARTIVRGLTDAGREAGLRI